jgi:hypothetical protein
MSGIGAINFHSPIYVNNSHSPIHVNNRGYLVITNKTPKADSDEARYNIG